MNIFICRDNEEYGPFSRGEVFSCLLRGEISNDDLARSEVDGEWRSLREVLQATAPASCPPAAGIIELPVQPDPVDALPVSGPQEELEEASGFDEMPANEESGVPAEVSESGGDPEGIFICRDNEESGPYSREDIFAALFRRELTNEDYARRGEDGEWRPLSEVLRATTPALGLPCNIQMPPGPRDPVETLPVSEAFIVQGGAAAFDETPANEDAPKAGMNGKAPRAHITHLQVTLIAGVVGMAFAFGAACLIFNQKKNPQELPKVTQGAPVVPRSSPSASAPIAKVIPSPKPAASAIVKAAKAIVAIMNAPRSTPVPVKPLPRSPTAIAVSARPKPAPTASSAAVATVQRIVLPATVRGDAMNLWVSCTTKKPRGILVLCLAGGRPDLAIKAPVWQKFASDNQLAMAGVTFSSNPKLEKRGEDFYQVDQGSGDLLIAGLNQVFGRSLPLIVYGEGSGGTYAELFANWQPQRMLLWGAYSDDWRGLPPAEKDSAPGIVACNCEILKKDSPVKKFFETGRLQGKPWTWVPMGIDGKLRKPEMEAFFIRYASAILSTDSLPEKYGIWADMDTSQTLSPLDFMSQPEKAVWLPSPEIRKNWAVLVHAASGPDSTMIVERNERTKNPAEPIMHLYLRLPRGAEGGTSVSGVLAYCTWENSEAKLVSRISAVSAGDPVVGSLLKFADNHNLAVLTWGTVDAWDKNLNTEEVTRKRQEQFDKNFEFLTNAWVRGVEGFGHDFGIPQKDFLLYGISRGAQWAHRLAMRKPEYFLAVHVHIPSTFDKPTPGANGPLWLVTTGEQEYGYERAQQFYQECQALGYPMIFKAYMGLGHADCAMEHDLGIQFFEYALAVKKAHEAWVLEANDPLDKLKRGNEYSGPWLASFRSPAFYGDFLNQECYPANQSDMIPAALRVPLPTKELADLWNK